MTPEDVDAVKALENWVNRNAMARSVSLHYSIGAWNVMLDDALGTQDVRCVTSSNRNLASAIKNALDEINPLTHTNP